MGRRKIEIKAIKDDRNRSVTFLKRKGGLFKKAHELSVLCSVDVAVIIFGQNKKLYQFSSGNIHDTIARHQYYAGPHEHKGPADFADKAGGDDDDDDEENMGTPPQEESPPHHGVVPQHYPNHPNHPGIQQMRQATPSASPPMGNGVYPQRMSTPQPQHLSRPSSRNAHARRASSNLVPQNHPHPQAQQPQYAYPPNAQYYQQHMQHAAPNAQMNPAQAQAHMQQQHYNQQMQQQQQQHHHQVQQAYLQEQRRQSMPPNFPQPAPQERQQQAVQYQSPPMFQRPFQSPPLPGHGQGQGPSHKPEPIDVKQRQVEPPLATDGRIMPRQPNTNDLAANESNISEAARSQSVDMGSALRNRQNAATPPTQGFQQPPPPQNPEEAKSQSRTTSISQPSGYHQISRVNSLASDTKRPQLKVQIPNEPSDAGSATGESSPKDSGATVTPTKVPTTESSHSSGVVLPPPSPSASALLSAGATGPKNPFARPPPPTSAIGGAVSYKDIETPMSALPSRFMSDGLLPSPSSFYPEWTFGGSSNNLASPAPYQPTPVAPHGPSFRDEDPDKKRKSPDDLEGSAHKKTRSQS